MSSDASKSPWWEISSWIVVSLFIEVGVWWFFYRPSVGKGGLLLAVGATLMPLCWEKIGTAAKMSWIAMLFLLLGVEYRTIDKDKVESDAKLTAHFQQISDQEKNDLRTILDSENARFKDILANQQNEFDATIKRMEHDEKTQARAFNDVLERENSMLALQVQTQLNSQEITLELPAIRREEEALRRPSATSVGTTPERLPPLEPEAMKQLKVQALELARDIDDWITSVSKDAPKLSAAIPQTSEEGKSWNAYLDRLSTEWIKKFAEPANSMVNKLQIQGLIRACIPGRPAERPSQILAFRSTCATAIEHAALDLK